MRLHFFLAFFLICQIAVAQDYQVINGKVTDQTTREAVAFAHVGIPEQGIGTITGYDGAFTLKIPAAYNNSVLIVSFLGYKTYKRPVNTIDRFLQIEIEPSATNLIEVVVRDEQGIEDIVRTAFNRIPKNYPDQATSLTGFYRESKTDGNQDYIYLAEGVLDIYKNDYKNQKEGEVGLIQGRQVMLNPKDEVRDVASISSGHLAAHRFDFVKYREDFIDPDNFSDYKYWMEGITSYNDQPVYIIGFDQEEGGTGRMIGTLFIDTTTFAFIRAEFEIRPDGLKKTSDYPLYVGRWNSNRYVVNYRKVEGKWQFSTALREGTRGDGGIYSNEIMITEYREKVKQVPYLERLNRGAAFLTLMGEYQEDFWKQYNTTPMSGALAESVQQMKTGAKAAEVFTPEYMAELQRQRDSIRAAEIAALAPAEDSVRQAPDEFPSEIRQRPRPEIKTKKTKVGLMTHYGAGLHWIESPATTMGISYLESPGGETILNTTGNLPAREFEIIYGIDASLVFNQRWYVRWGITRDFLNSIYREHSFGLGTQFNLSKGRPVFLRPTASYSSFKYARKIGQAENTYGDFEADNKKFKSEAVNMYYGSRTINLKGSLELAVELRPGLDLFGRATYLYPLAQQDRIYLWERKRFSRKRVHLPINDQVILDLDDPVREGNIANFESWLFTVGVVLK